MMVKLLKMKFAKNLVFTILLLISGVHYAQESGKSRENLSFNGYIKFMETITFSDFTNGNPVDNLVHNRMNFSYFTEGGSTWVAQFRNRIFFGESVRSIPNYGDFVNEYNGILPLEWLWVNNDDLVFSTIVDRLYYDYANEKFQIRMGRQRINWGINTTWNPNDLFNNYNIYDFDYEEREGGDAIRMQFFPDYLSSFDFAYKFTGNWATDVTALKYRFNKWNYDFQMLGGKFEEQIALGTGWAGNIGTLGFKGELTFFDDYTSTDTSLSASTSLDYAFVNGFYFLGTYLYNSNGTNELINPNLSISEVPNAANLMPATHNVMFNGSYPFSPIISASIATLYSFGVHSLTLFPALNLGLATNFDLDLFGQLFWQELPQQEFDNIGNGVYWRLKWSF